MARRRNVSTRVYSLGDGYYYEILVDGQSVNSGGPYETRGEAQGWATELAPDYYYYED